MISTRTARMLTRYNRWANALMLDAVAKLPPGEAAKERTTLFKNIVHTLNHNYVIDAIFQAHLEGPRSRLHRPQHGGAAGARRASDRAARRWTTGGSRGATVSPTRRSTRR